jgi:FtsH-binding integral membrane protein
VTSILLVLELIAAALIALQAIQRINRMSRCTALPWFLSWAVLGGSAAIVAGVVAGKTVPDGYSAAVLVAAAAVFTLDRRRH